VNKRNDLHRGSDVNVGVNVNVTAEGTRQRPSSYSDLTNQLAFQLASFIDPGAKPAPEAHLLQQHGKERENLLNIFKLTVKTLLSYGMDLGEPITDECEQLNHFCIVMEHVMQHGLKCKFIYFIYLNFI